MKVSVVFFFTSALALVVRHGNGICYDVCLLRICLIVMAAVVVGD